MEQNDPIKKDATKEPNGNDVLKYFKNLFIVEEVDFVKASENIRKDVSFRGFNIWILICSILVCSLGLNLNSTAVVIGAMLISPLMGPINGLGLAIGTFDRNLLRKSMLNLGVAAFVSIITAAIFFWITPTGDDLHELFSRTKPIVLDLFVAFFGGVAGILAASRCINTNVVPGVAIATALMPPLCTAGYGLATLQLDYFLGAFYLFFMNCVMISLAAVLIVLYLKYPKYSFVDHKTKRRVRGGILAFVLILSVPSVVVYYNLLKETALDERVEDFVDHELKMDPLVYVSSYERIDQDTTKQIRVVTTGKRLYKEELLDLQNKLSKYKLNDYRLVVYQSNGGLHDDELANIGEKFKVDLLEDLYTKNEEKMRSKEDEIEFLREEIRHLNLNNIAVDKLAHLIQSQFDIDRIGVNNMVYLSTSGKADTIPTVLVQWNPKIEDEQKSVQVQKLTDLLKIQLEKDSVKVIPYK